MLKSARTTSSETVLMDLVAKMLLLLLLNLTEEVGCCHEEILDRSYLLIMR